MSKTLPQFTDWHSDLPKLRVAQPVPSPRPIWEPDTGNVTCIRWDIDCKFSPDWRYWKRLDEHNSGLRNGEWTNEPYTKYQRNKHTIEALSSQLDLSERLRAISYRRYIGLDLEDWGRSAALIAFCVCALTVHQDEICTERSYHPNQNVVNKDSLFERIRRSLGLREKDVAAEYGKLERHFITGGVTDLSYLEFEQAPPEEGYKYS